MIELYSHTTLTLFALPVFVTLSVAVFIFGSNVADYIDDRLAARKRARRLNRVMSQIRKW